VTDIACRCAAISARVRPFLKRGVPLFVVLGLVAAASVAWAQAGVPGAAVVTGAPPMGTVPDYLNVGFALYALTRIEAAIREAIAIGRAVVAGIDRAVDSGNDRTRELDKSTQGLQVAIEKLTGSIQGSRETQNATRLTS
jgi:hypothetical protein